MKKHTINLIKRTLFMSGIFIAALLVYFFISFRSMEHATEVYSTLDESKLPVLYVETNGYIINPMHAYIQEMGNKAVRDMITILPEDRQLKLNIWEYDHTAISAKYEIRSLNLEQLIEKGDIKSIDKDGNNTSIIVPIQNLIKKEQQYLLKVILDTGEKTLNYYTRILWTDKDHTKELEDIAIGFTLCTFDKNEAKNLSTYLESNNIADNNTLAHITLHNSFNQITWGDTGMKLSGQYYVTFKEYDGLMSEIQIKYESEMENEGEKSVFDNEDNYVLRYDPSRIYIMNFDRKTHEVFNRKTDSVKNKKLMLGIGNQEDISVVTSENKDYIAFKSNKDLWIYEQGKNPKATEIFSFRTNDSLRQNLDLHDIKILSVEENGNVNFLLYGYINRGQHEGKTGIVYYTYDYAKETVIENFIIPLSESYEVIKENINRLAYLTKDNRLYMYYKGNIFGIDTNSFEVLMVESGLNEIEFASSGSQRYVAYQNPKAEDPYHSRKITHIDLEKNIKIDILKNNSYIRVLGFNQDDLIYGEIDEENADSLTYDSDIPVSAIHITDAETNEKTEYKKEGLYFTNVSVDGNRIKFDEISKTGNGNYKYVKSETIISNKNTNEESEVVATVNSGKFGKVKYIEINDIGTKQVKYQTAKNYSIERASNIELNISEATEKTPVFYAYSLGHYRSKERTLKDAYGKVRDDYGYVIDKDGDIIWNRADKSAIVKINKASDKISGISQLLSNANEKETIQRVEEFTILNASGMDMNSALYYLNKGYPLIVYVNDEKNYITAYDQRNITLTDKNGNSQTVIGREDAEKLFESNRNRFIAILP